MEVITKSASETQILGEKIADYLSPHRSYASVVTLQGELGSGKTTFSQGMAKGLGITDRLLSPTFIILRQYEIHHRNFHWLYHIDLYKLENVEEVKDLGLLEILADLLNIVVIEWPEKAEVILPEKKIALSFSGAADTDNRSIIIVDTLLDYKYALQT